MELGASVWRVAAAADGAYGVAASGARDHPYPDKAVTLGRDVDPARMTKLAATVVVTGCSLRR